MLVILELYADQATCSRGQFACDDGTCIELQLQCDGVPDCADRSDEHGCGQCQFLPRDATQSAVMPKIPLRTFPHNFSVDGEAAKTCQLVADLLATRPTSPQQVGNNGIWETTRRNRHNGLLPTPTCYGLVVYVADFLWTCYGEVANFLRTCYGEMDFGLYATVCCPSVCPSVYLTVCDVHVR